MNTIPPPLSGDFAPYYQKYIDHIWQEDIPLLLRKNAYSVPAMLYELSTDQWNYRYAPEKWTLAQVIMHLMDSEQVFCYRALRIARGDQTPLPGFDQDVFAQNCDVSKREPHSMIEEYHTTRKATLALLDGLEQEAMQRRGTASDHEVTVAALFYIIAGHESHHLQILQDRYLSR